MKKPITFYEDEEGCLICDSHASHHKDGHAYFKHRGQRKQVSRHIYEECFGEIPPKMMVRHMCGKARCINPEHLKLGTMQDAVKEREAQNKTARGESHGRSKLSEDDVIFIRSSKETDSELAVMYGVDKRLVNGIRNYRYWKHVQ